MRWVTFFFLGVALATGWAITIDLPIRPERSALPDVAARDHLGRARVEAVLEARRVDALDATGSRLLAEVGPDGGFFMDEGARAALVEADRFQALVEGFVAAHRSEVGPVRIGRFVVEMTGAPWARTLNRPERMTFIGIHEGVPYCIRTSLVRRRGRRAVHRTASLKTVVEELGACGLVARFGLPGPKVAEWLAAVGDNALRLWEEPDPRWRYWSGNDPAATFRACHAGIRTACGEVLRATLPPGAGWVADDGTPIRHIGDDSSLGLVGFFPTLVRDLVQDFGEDAFGKFWRSPLPVPDAFTAAFDADPDDWSYRRALRLAVPTRAGPGPSPLQLLLPLLIGLAGLWTGTGFARRRRAE